MSDEPIDPKDNPADVLKALYGEDSIDHREFETWKKFLDEYPAQVELAFDYSPSACRTPRADKSQTWREFKERLEAGGYKIPDDQLIKVGLYDETLVQIVDIRPSGATPVIGLTVTMKPLLE